MPAKIFLEECLRTQQESIKHYQFNNQRVWVKKAGKRHSIWLYKALGLLSKALKMQALTPVPNLGGQHSISTEVQRLQELRNQAINVPELLAYNDDGLMMADVGSTQSSSQQLEMALKQSTSPEECLELYQLIVDELHNVHRKETWLSEAFLRNMVFDKNQQIAFLDFESNPGLYMNKQLCFARDWLCLIFSSSIYLKKNNVLEQGSSYLQETIKKESETTYKEVVAATRLLHWANKLPLEKMGKDGTRLVAVITLLAYLKALL